MMAGKTQLGARQNRGSGGSSNDSGYAAKINERTVLHAVCMLDGQNPAYSRPKSDLNLIFDIIPLMSFFNHPFF